MDKNKTLCKSLVKEIIFLLIVVSACSKTTNFVDITSKSYLEVPLDSIQISQNIFKPMGMVANDSQIIIYDQVFDTLFRVYRSSDCKYLGWFGKKGRGPNEFLLINASAIRIIEKYLQFADFRKVYYISLPRKSITNNYTIKEEILVPSSLLPLNRTFALDTYRIYGVCRQRVSDNSLDFFNKDNDSIGSFIEYPNYLKNIPNNVKRYLYDYEIEIKPNQKSFAMIYLYFPFLRIYNKISNKIQEIEIRGLPKQIVFNSLANKNSNLLNGIVYYPQIKTTNNYIYLYYNPIKGERIDEHRFDLKPLGPNEIHIFSWEGKLIARIRLSKNLSCCTPTPDDKYLYFMNMDESDKIFRYLIYNYLK